MTQTYNGEFELKKTVSIQVKLTIPQLEKFTEKAMEEGFSNATECLRYLILRFGQEGK
jgi:hypothetical protein